MAEQSKIEWCDGTFNPWIGCTKVSPGCANCYAANSTRARVLRAGGQETWGKGAPRSRTKTWGAPVKWNKAAAGAARRPRIFCASLADWLDDEVPVSWQNDLLRLIEATPHLDWLLLTKRPLNWEGVMSNALLADPYIEMAHEWVNGRPPANVWLGTTCEDQARANERIPALLKIPARVRFLSCEPLLGPVNFNLSPAVMKGGYNVLRPYRPPGCTSPEQPRIHWVIGGGESGPGARPMHASWARFLRDQCQAYEVPFLFKQWGEHDAAGVKVGKKKAGRELDGKTWDEFPEVVTM